MNKLFTPTKLGNIELKNHIVMAPLTRSRAIHNIPNELMTEYYKQRSGAGLIITEGTSPSINGLGYARIPGIFSQDQISGWKNVTKAVHENKGKIFLQIMHTGRVSHPANFPAGAKVLAPSATALNGQMWTDAQGMQPYPVPQEMTLQDIKEAQAEYVQAAKNAIAAGFDGIELHAANGYLLEQFLNPAANKRTDSYGGSASNRLRFFLEVAEATAKAIGGDKVGVRVSPYGVFNDMGPFEGIEEFYSELAKNVSALGFAYIHIVDHSSMGAPAVSDTIKTKIRENFKGKVILSGGYDAKRAEHDVLEGRADLIAFGRPFISNPNLVEKLEKNLPLTPANPDTFYTPGPEGYTDYL